MARRSTPDDRRFPFLLIGAGLVVVIAVVVFKAFESHDSAPRLTVCESAWQEAERSVSDAGPASDAELRVKPTLTACDTIAEWDAANVRFHSSIGEGAPVVVGLCDKLGASTALCAQAKQAVVPSGP